MSCVLITGITNAQTPFNQRSAFSIGLKGNVNLVGIANQNNYGQNEMDYELTPGFGAGVLASLHLDHQNSVSAALTYQSHGQKYKDSFKGSDFEKEVRYQMLSLPVYYKRMLTETSGGYAGVGSESKPRWYLLGGFQVDRLLSPNIDWYLNGSETDFLSFVLEGGNPNQALIEAMGAPASDEDLFTDWDIMFILGGGFELPVSTQVMFSIELRGGIGLTDINAKDWRLENNQGVYGASRNAFAGLHVGIHYMFVTQ